MIGFCYRHVTELTNVKEDEQLSRWLREALLRIFTAVERARESQVPPIVREALSAIRANIDGPSVAEIRDVVARKVGISSRQLTALLKERMGRTFADLLREARVERACELLAEANQTVAAIASDAGFCDQSYFTHVFQRIKKTTPKQYRDTALGHSASPITISPDALGSADRALKSKKKNTRSPKICPKT